MTLQEVMAELEAQGSEQTKKVLTKHGAREPFFGVKVEYLKKIQKKTKKDYELALELYDTGNSDAMYLAGLIADETKMTKTDLNNWAENAYWYMISDYTVAWVAAESKFGLELALEWINSDKEFVSSAGWATLSSLVALKDDAELNIELLSNLLERVEKTIHQAKNRTRNSMNGFVISIGTYVVPLTENALAVGKKIGKVSVNVGETSCKVPIAVDYIEKNRKMGRIGKKRKIARC